MLWWWLIFLLSINCSAYDLQELINQRRSLSLFSNLLKENEAIWNILENPISVFVPNNEAILRTNLLSENELRYHMTKSVIRLDSVERKVSSMADGATPLWLSKSNTIFTHVNQASIIQNITGISKNGKLQVLFIIDSVLKPLEPLSTKESKYQEKIDANKLMTYSNIYDLSDNYIYIFNECVKNNNKNRMYSVPGGHTFFIPVDKFFKKSIEYSHSINSRRNTYKQNLDCSLIDDITIQGHIIPSHVLFTSHESLISYPTVAWFINGVQVNISLSQEMKNDVTLVKSITIVGDYSHSEGIVSARVVKGDIPVTNGVVHLISKPLVIVAHSFFQYIVIQSENKNSKVNLFCKMILDKGGWFLEALRTGNDGTLMLPSNEAVKRGNAEKLSNILGNSILRTRFFGLHFIRTKILTNNEKTSGKVISYPASSPSDLVWVHTQGSITTIEARGVNATIIDGDIAASNGVIHVLDKMLGVPYQTVLEKIKMDIRMKKTKDIIRNNGLEVLFQSQSNYFYTFLAPTDEAWNKVDFYDDLMSGKNPHYAKTIIMRHLKTDITSYSFEELVELSRSRPKQMVDMNVGDVQFSQLGEHSGGAYKENFMRWSHSYQGKIIRPNMELTDGYIHAVNVVMMDNLEDYFYELVNSSAYHQEKFVLNLLYIIIFYIAI